MEIVGSNVNSLFSDALWWIKSAGKVQESRNGKVKTSLEPVTLISLFPTERVLICKERYENPIFHFVECLWMMAGKQDAASLEKYNPRMGTFAEPNGDIWGAYGHRWREHFGIDQILRAVTMLKANPWDRRVVIAMWDPTTDLGADKKDLPCNTHIYLRRRDTSLDMTVCNRSNDLIWGALGSNVVHFSFLLELIAHEVGLQVGKMYQFTNNLHVYERHWHFVDIPPTPETYNQANVKPYPLIKGSLMNWLYDCRKFFAYLYSPTPKMRDFKEPFFNEVALPIVEGKFSDCQASDWRLVCERYRARKEGI